eukprot:CAMPEP_0184643466 /NCGR_PEP_ID=MMETSP0308-20130426/312_1 /TAXON_ID=38269 /ORGANISM="Gloeochaete witrockiana, Strain SAG 46.84" /LENGTH=192 /DNA_ID=CAMNT_0027071421 /DNA_START=1143 /DNA_END=1718 /DNA_ORIENTATION=+
MPKAKKQSAGFSSTTPYSSKSAKVVSSSEPEGRSATDPRERIHFPTRIEFREWLAANHALSPGFWMIKKKSAPSVPYDDAVEEALCFGWIDSAVNKWDADRTLNLFTPRRKKSPWSALNKRRIEKMEKEGLMTEAGRRVIDQAKEDGSWNLLNEAESMIIPQDLEEAFAEYSAAKENFENFPPSVRKNILFW